MTEACHAILHKTANKLINPGPAGPVSIRIRYACLCGGLRIYPGSPGK